MINILKTGSTAERLAVVQSDYVTPKVLRLAIDNFNASVAIEAAKSKNADASVLEAALRKDKNIDLQKAAVQNPNIDAATLTLAYSLTKATVQSLIFKNKKCPKKVIEWAMKDFPYVRSQVALSPVLSRKQLTELLNDKDASVRANALFNEKTTLLDVMKAMKDNVELVRDTAKDKLKEMKKTVKFKDDDE
jgi:hypothetical protein